MKIYLDHCCYNRPFDDQNGIMIRIETEAKLFIQHEIYTGRIDLVWSSMNDYENNDNPSLEKSERIAVWRGIAKEIVKTNDEILNNALKLEKTGLKPKDALHIASAIAARCDFFLTTDKGILNKQQIGIRAINPVSFVEGYLNEK